MKQVGSRRSQEVTAQASGLLLAQSARFNESMARLSKTRYIPKGVYRFSSHAQANQHDQDCLARAMAVLTLARQHE
jgi:hypothetical protein